MLSNIKKYWKTVIASVPVAVFIGNEAIQAAEVFGADGTVTTEDWLRILLTVATAVGVYAKANETNNPTADADMSVRRKQ